ncbi:Alpha/Beta hydrolase protein [Lactarius indigo]|nr:Alpha/Beta hydrolase protein [Lactarius indigo]
MPIIAAMVPRCATIGRRIEQGDNIPPVAGEADWRYLMDFRPSPSKRIPAVALGQMQSGFRAARAITPEHNGFDDINGGGYYLNHRTSEANLNTEYNQAMVYPSPRTFYSTVARCWRQLESTNHPQTISTPYGDYKKCNPFAQLRMRGGVISASGDGHCMPEDGSRSQFVPLSSYHRNHKSFTTSEVAAGLQVPGPLAWGTMGRTPSSQRASPGRLLEPLSAPEIPIGGCAHLPAAPLQPIRRPVQIVVDNMDDVVLVSDDALALLKRKLDDTSLPDKVNAADWAYGAPLADIKRLANRWKDGYDWRTHEHKLNGLPMFTRTIGVDGFGELRVHYVHQKRAPKEAIPLLFVHGSGVESYVMCKPGNFIEVKRVLPLLTAFSTDRPSFHVVAPNLPGYAWSEAVLEKGLNAGHYAELFNKLMISLGYTGYVTQGGDWGHILTLTTTSLYGAKHVKASHTNLLICEPPTYGNPIILLLCLILSFTSREREAAAASQDFFKNGVGYFREQSTKPQTLGFSLADSPVGLLASQFISSRARGPQRPSVKIYYEIGGAVIGSLKTTVPVSLSFFLKEPARFPEPLLRSRGRIQQRKALVGDLWKMFANSGPAGGVVPGCNGYRTEGKDDSYCLTDIITIACERLQAAPSPPDSEWQVRNGTSAFLSPDWSVAIAFTLCISEPPVARWP